MERKEDSDGETPPKRQKENETGEESVNNFGMREGLTPIPERKRKIPTRLMPQLDCKWKSRRGKKKKSVMERFRKRHRCRACGRRFYFVAHLNQHISTCKHSSCPNKRERAQDHMELAARCRKCSKKFDTSARMMQHGERNPNSLKCHICERSFNTPEELGMHFHSKHLLTDPPYVCYNCPYFSDTVEQFLLHNRTIHKFKVFCSYCPYILATWDACLLHEMSNHTAIDNTKPYCQICNKSFATTDTFTVHFKTFHSSKKGWYTCIHCKAIVQDKQFRIHMRKHKFPYWCRFCTREFISLRSLHVHRCKRNIAPRQTSQRCICNLCGRKFRYRKSMEDHMYIHKFDIVYVCQICSKTFRNHLDVQIHMKEHENSPTAKSGTLEDSDNLDIVSDTLAVGRIQARSRTSTEKSKTNIDTVSGTSTAENKTMSDNMQTKISMATFDAAKDNTNVITKTLTGEILRNLEIVSGQLMIKHPDPIYVRTGGNDETINAPIPSMSIDQNRKVLEIISGSLTVKISEDISRLLMQNTENMRAKTTHSFPVTIPPTKTNLEIISDPSHVKVTGRSKPRTSKNSGAKSKAVTKSKPIPKSKDRTTTKSKDATKSKAAKKNQAGTRSTWKNNKLETKSTAESQGVSISPRNKSLAPLEIVPSQSSINRQKRMLRSSTGETSVGPISVISFNQSPGKSCSIKENSNDKFHIVPGTSNEEGAPSNSSNLRAKSKPKRRRRSFKNKKKLYVRNEKDTISKSNNEKIIPKDKISFTYKPSECEQEFCSEMDLDSHDYSRDMAKFKPETRTNQCSTCEKKFITTNNLELYDSEETTLNSGTESNLKDVMCPNCNEEFKTSTDLISHNCKSANHEAHTNETNVDYKCPVCCLKFKSLAELKSHGCKGTIDTLTPESDTISKDTIPFNHTCLMCGITCNTAMEVVWHDCKIDKSGSSRISNAPSETRIKSNFQTELMCTSTMCNKKFPTITELLSHDCPGSEKMSYVTTGPIDDDTITKFQTQSPRLPKLSMQKYGTDTCSNVNINRNDSPADPSIMDSLKLKIVPIVHSENSPLDMTESRITPRFISKYQCIHCKRFFQYEIEAKMHKCYNVDWQPLTQKIPIQKNSYEVRTFPSKSDSSADNRQSDSAEFKTTPRLQGTLIKMDFSSELNQETATCQNEQSQSKSEETDNAYVEKFLEEPDPVMDSAIATSIDILDDFILGKFTYPFKCNLCGNEFDGSVRHDCSNKVMEAKPSTSTYNPSQIPKLGSPTKSSPSDPKVDNDFLKPRLCPDCGEEFSTVYRLSTHKC